MSSLKYSELESKRFEKEIFRGHMDVFHIEQFEEFYKANDPDILIVRIPVAEQHKLHQLNSLNKEIIHADTLVYYEVDLTNTAYNPLKNSDLVFAKTDSTSKEIFREMVPKIFRNYTTHYFSNPLLDKLKITEGYMEWAVSNMENPGNLHLLIYRNGIPIAFITCSYDASYAEIILNGVLPEHQKGGVYTDIIRYIKDHFKKQNILALKISTQIQNFPVQRVWVREGFLLSNAYVTIHLNKIITPHT